MGGPNAGEAMGLGFDHGLEVVAAPRTLLLEVRADGCQVFVGESFFQDLPIGGCAQKQGSESSFLLIGRVCTKNGKNMGQSRISC